MEEDLGRVQQILLHYLDLFKNYFLFELRLHFLREQVIKLRFRSKNDRKSTRLICKWMIMLECSQRYTPNIAELKDSFVDDME